MIVDFRKIAGVKNNVTINNVVIECTACYKYLGVEIDNKLTFSKHVKTQSRKMAKRMYCVKKLKRLGVKHKLTTMAFNSFVKSLTAYCSTVFLSMLTKKDTRIFLSAMRVADVMRLGNATKVVENIKEGSMKLMLKIRNDSSHILHRELEHHIRDNSRTRRSSTMTFCRTERYLKSLIPNNLRRLSNC